MSAPSAAAVSTSDLYDEFGESLDCCDLSFRQFGGRPAFSGLVATVQCHEDNVLLKAVLSEPGDGRVLVVDGGGSRYCALMGGAIATLGMGNGWAGVIINGAVRDAVELRSLDLGVKALWTSPRRSGKSGAGRRDVPVSFGGATFTPGHEVHSDDDGVVVVDPAVRR